MAARLMPRGALLWAVPVALGLVGFGALEFSPLRIGPADARAADAATPSKWSVAQKVEFKDPNSGYWYVGTIFRVNGDEHDVVFDRAPSMRATVSGKMIRRWTPGNVGPDPVIDPKTGKPDNSVPKAEPTPAPAPAAPAEAKPAEAKPAAPAEAKPAAPADKPAAPKPKWRIGQRVDFKPHEMGPWYPGTIKIVRQDEFEISYDGWPGGGPLAKVPIRLVRPWTRGNEGPGPILDPKTRFPDISQPADRPADEASPAQSDTIAPESGPKTWKVGDRVDAKLGMGWWPATVKAVKGDEFQVHGDDGRDTWLPASKIAEYGKGALKQLREDNPFGGAAESSDRPLTPCSTTAALEVSIPATDAAWSLAADPATRVSLPTQPITLRSKTSGAPCPVDSCFFVAGSIWVAVKEELSVEAQTLERIDPSGKTASKSWKLQRGFSLQSISPDGKRLALVSAGFYEGNRNRVDVWSLEGDELKYMVGFTPETSGGDSARTVTFAEFVDANHLLVISGDTVSTLRLVEVPSCKTIWIAATERSGAALSPGRKQVALTGSKRMLVLDTSSGKLLASTSKAAGVLKSMFRPDGAALAGCCDGRIAAWDLKAGALTTDMQVSIYPARPPAWVSDDSVMVGTYLVSLSKSAICWNYPTITSNTPLVSADGRAWFAEHKDNDGFGPTILFSVSLPHEGARSAMEKAASIEYLVAAGAQISIKSEITDPVLSAEAAKILTQNLTQLGYRVVPDAPVKAIMFINPGTPAEYSFREFGSAQVIRRVLTIPLPGIKIVAPDGKVAWQMAAQPRLDEMQTSRDRTLDWILAEVQKPQLKFYERVPVPDRIAKPIDLSKIPSSTVTVGGVKN